MAVVLLYERTGFGACHWDEFHTRSLLNVEAPGKGTTQGLDVSIPGRYLVVMTPTDQSSQTEPLSSSPDSGAPLQWQIHTVPEFTPGGGPYPEVRLSTKVYAYWNPVLGPAEPYPSSEAFVELAAYLDREKIAVDGVRSNLTHGSHYLGMVIV